MMKYLQRLGKSLMLPVACLPVAGILLGIGYWLESSLGSNIPATFLLQAGGAILNHIPLLFAVGVAVGMADESNGASALAGLVSWLVITTLLSPATVQMFSGQTADPAFEKIENVFTGILSGITGTFCYNRFKNTSLPDALAFFGGKRSVPIVAAGLACLISILLFFSWPLMYNGLILFGKSILDTGPVGAGLYAFFNRLLIPLGLHHALNQVFWFDVAGINDLSNFWTGQGTLGITGQYMTGFFPIMMFGLPAAALAMYHTARPERKKAVGGLMLASALSAFLTGVTEALRFNLFYGGKSASEALADGDAAPAEEVIPPVSEETPVFRNIFIRDVYSHNSRRAMLFNGLPEMNIENIQIENAVFTSQIGAELTESTQIKLKNVGIYPREGPALILYNVKNLEAENIQIPEGMKNPVRISGQRNQNIKLPDNLD
jgi:phosphotransferase system  glucose/maltose/N-acetylglucosamine-specific IIC component